MGLASRDDGLAGGHQSESEVAVGVDWNRASRGYRLVDELRLGKRLGSRW